MEKMYKMTAFALLIMSLAVVFGGIFYAENVIPTQGAIAAEIAMGRTLFLNRCLIVATLIMLFSNAAIGYAILTNQKPCEKE